VHGVSSSKTCSSAGHAQSLRSAQLHMEKVGKDDEVEQSSSHKRSRSLQSRASVGLGHNVPRELK
jgi:hypothetical protein